MRAIFTHRRSLAAEAISGREAGPSSHCAVDLGDRIVDATFRHGVKSWTREEFFKMHTLVSAYEMKLEDESTARRWWETEAQSKRMYDVLRIIGYILWRTLGSSKAHSCDEVLLIGAEFGGFSLITGNKRPGVRLLHEAFGRSGVDVTHQYYGDHSVERNGQLFPTEPQ
jgi:hypothetical protein